MLFLHLNGTIGEGSYWGTSGPLAAVDDRGLGNELPEDANTIILSSGEAPSKACLLLPSSALSLISRTNFHSIELVSYLPNRQSFATQGWVFTGYEELDSSLGEEALCAVRFEDRRKLFEKSAPPASGYNVVNPEGVEPPAGSYNPDDPSLFPYDPASLIPGMGVPWHWVNSTYEQGVLNDLWSRLPQGGDFPSSPSGMSFPVHRPVDVVPQERSAWKLFVDLIHSAGWEIFPLLNGNFHLAPIDHHFHQGFSELPHHRFLIDLVRSEPPDLRNLPEKFRIGFPIRNRRRKFRNASRYYFVQVDTSSVIPPGLSPKAIYSDCTETLLNGGMSAVFHSGSGEGGLPENFSSLVALATYWVTRIVTQRLAPHVAHQYTGFQERTSKPEFPRVEFHGKGGGPYTNLCSVVYRLGASVDPLLDKLPPGEEASLTRWFELVSGKFTSHSTAEVKFLDHNGNMVDPSVTVVDRDGLFCGRPADYVEEENGFRGIAQLCQDASEAQPPRWEIVEMEGFARWVVASYQGGVSGDPDERKAVDWFRFEGVYNLNDRWERKPPAKEGDPIKWESNPLVDPLVGDKVLLKLKESDGVDPPSGGWSWEPTYVPVAVLDRTVFVQVRSLSESDPEGHPVGKTSGGVFPGRKGNKVGVTPSDSDFTDPCWITDLSGSSTLPNKAKYLGRFTELFDPDPGEAGSDERPRYAIRHSQPLEVFTAHVSTAIGAGSANAPTEGSGLVYEVGADGSTSPLGTKTIWNPFNHKVRGACCVSKLDDSNYLVNGFDLLEALYLLENAGARTVLHIPEDTTGPTSIQWQDTVKCSEIPT